MAPESGTGVRVARGVLYVFACIMAVVVVVALVFLAYYTAEATANVNMIAKDAFAKRAQVVLLPVEGEEEDDQAVLERLFTEYGLATDEMLNGGHYEAFTISNYFESASVDSHVIWPWQDTATVRVTEKVRDIKGRLKQSQEGDVPADTEMAPPDWMNGVYEVDFVKDGATGSWRINSMRLVEPIVLPKETASATPADTPAGTAGAAGE